MAREPPAAATAVAQPGRPFSTLATVGLLSVPEKVAPDEKSPLLSSAPVGTKTDCESMPLTVRRPSYDPKINVLSFLMGPPNVPPNWFCLNPGLGAGEKVKARAFRTSLRKNS